MFDRLYRMPVDEFEAKLDKEGGRLLDGETWDQFPEAEK
jgi:hypothetical protein